MRRKIPSNAALMAFEAAARHGSFARAAAELSLTEGAISRQIGRLEAFLGVMLFERVGNRVRLLPNGERCAAQVRELLDLLERESQYLMGQPIDGASLDIAIIPTFAMRWLIPRLSQFQQKHPNISVHLAERMEPFVLAGSGFDAAIHFEHPAWTGMRTYPLLQEVLVPVCHPALFCIGHATTSASAAEPRCLGTLFPGSRGPADESCDGCALRSSCNADRGCIGRPRCRLGAAPLRCNRVGTRPLGRSLARWKNHLQDLLHRPSRAPWIERKTNPGIHPMDTG